MRVQRSFADPGMRTPPTDNPLNPSSNTDNPLNPSSNTDNPLNPSSNTDNPLNTDIPTYSNEQSSNRGRYSSNSSSHGYSNQPSSHNYNTDKNYSKQSSNANDPLSTQWDHLNNPGWMPIDDQIILDHKDIRNFFDEYEKASMANHPDDARRWYHQFAWAVARHAAAEETILYPLFEAYLGDYGKEVADRNRGEHLQVKLTLTELESMSIKNSSFPSKMKDLMARLDEHMSHEENEELVKFREDCPENERFKAGATFERRKWLAPTRPHPMAPDQPAFLESLVGLMTAPVDKMMDLFRSFPSNEEIERARTAKKNQEQDEVLKKSPLT